MAHEFTERAAEILPAILALMEELVVEFDQVSPESLTNAGTAVEVGTLGGMLMPILQNTESLHDMVNEFKEAP